MDQMLIGKISAFHAVGETHLVEVKTTQGELFNIEFSKTAVLHIDLKINNIVIDVSKKIDLI